MRSFKEVDISPDKCPDDFKYIHCPLVEEDLSFDNIDSPAMQAFAKSVGEGYKNIVLTHGDNLAKIINIISSNINAVSYTHLDVYKRQPLYLQAYRL